MWTTSWQVAHAKCYRTIMSGHVTFTWWDLQARANSIYVGSVIFNGSCSLRSNILYLLSVFSFIDANPVIRILRYRDKVLVFQTIA